MSSQAKVLMVLLYALVAAIFSYLHFERATDAFGATLEKLTEFTAPAPFSYRVLVPSIASTLIGITSLSYYSAYLLLGMVSVLGTLIAFRQLLLEYFNEWESSLFALVLLIPMTFNYIVFADYIGPWDFPSMMFFVIGVWLIWKERFFSLLFLIALATLNRETSILIVAAYCFANIAKANWREVLARTVVLVLLWSAVKLTVQFLSSGHGGVVAEDAFGYNLWLLERTVAGDAERILPLLFAFGGFHWVFVLRIWRMRERIRRLGAVAPILILVMIPVGRFSEERIFNELVPIFTLVTVLAVAGSRASRPDERRGISDRD